MLVACEETRSRAHGQHTEVFPGANTTSARPRPAPGGRENGFFGGTRFQGDSPAVSIARSEPRTPLATPKTSSMTQRLRFPIRGVRHLRCQSPQQKLPHQVIRGMAAGLNQSVLQRQGHPSAGRRVVKI